MFKDVLSEFFCIDNFFNIFFIVYFVGNSYKLFFVVVGDIGIELRIFKMAVVQFEGFY